MKPFSALYYIKHNAARMVALILVITMSGLCYLIGLYITNPYYENLINIEFYKDFTIIAPKETADSESQFNDLLESRDSITNVSHVLDADYFFHSATLGGALHVNYFSGILFMTILGFKGGVPYPVFHEMSDFKRFTEVLGLPCPDSDRSLIMGEKLAKRMNLAFGDAVVNDSNLVFGFNDDLILAATYSESAFGVPGAYTFFRMDSSFSPPEGGVPEAILLLREKEDETGDIPHKQEGLYETVNALKELYPDLLYIDYEDNEAYVRATFMSFWPYFIIVLVIMGALITFTAAGIFSVILQKRDYEFGVYEAIGFSRPSVLLKGVTEVLLINVISICISSLLIFLTVYLLNALLLFDRGLELYYFSSMSVAAFVSCNVAVFLSLLFMQIRWILRSALIK